MGRKLRLASDDAQDDAANKRNKETYKLSIQLFHNIYNEDCIHMDYSNIIFIQNKYNRYNV